VSADGLTVTVVATGPEPLDLTAADAAVLGVPRVFVFTGRGTATLDPATGSVISGSIVGHIQVNLCTALS
jgi:electron transfer flavoprotein alpha/beta subunit